MKSFLACLLVLVAAGTASAQCAGGRCVTRTVTRGWYSAPMVQYSAPVVQYSAPVVQYSAPVVTERTIVTAPATVVTAPAMVAAPVVVGFRRPLLGWRYNFSLVSPVVVESGPMVVSWSLIQ